MQFAALQSSRRLTSPGEEGRGEAACNLVALADSCLVHIYALNLCAAVMLAKLAERVALNRERSTDWSLLCDSNTVAAGSDQCSLHCLSACYLWSWMSCAVLALPKAFLIQTLRAAEPKLAWTKNFSVQSAVLPSPLVKESLFRDPHSMYLKARRNEACNKCYT